MTAAFCSLAGVMVGVVGHKLWRVAWRVRRRLVSWGAAVTEEFAPPTPEVRDRIRARTPSPTEVA